MRFRILLFNLRDVPIPQQFFPKAAKFSPGKKLRSFGTIFNKDRLASTRRFKRGRQGIRDAHASAFLVVPGPGLRFVVVEAASAWIWAPAALLELAAKRWHSARSRRARKKGGSHLSGLHRLFLASGSWCSGDPVRQEEGRKTMVMR
jgi:hypothetical protein